MYIRAVERHQFSNYCDTRTEQHSKRTAMMKIFCLIVLIGVFGAVVQVTQVPRLLLNAKCSKNDSFVFRLMTRRSMKLLDSLLLYHFGLLNIKAVR